MKNNTITADSAFLKSACALALFFIICFFVLFGLDNSPIFNDEGFVARSKNSILSLSFYTSLRPFTTDLFYKLWGSKPEQIVVGQKIVHVLSWTFLGLCTSLTLRNRIAAFCSLAVFSSVGLWWNVLGWTNVMRSESLSFSLFALWTGVLLLFIAFGGTGLFIITCAVTFFLSFTRDSMPFFLIGFAALSGALLFVLNRPASTARKKYMYAYAIVVGCTCVLQFLSIKCAEPYPRYTFTMTNNILQRILPDNDAYAWFRQRGMPEFPGREQWQGMWASSHAKALFREKRYQKFMGWIKTDASRVYCAYLLFHPGHMFLDAWSGKTKIFSYNLFGYTGWLPHDSSAIKLVSHFWYPPGCSLLILAYAAVIVALWFFRGKEMRFVIAVLLFGPVLVAAIRTVPGEAINAAALAVICVCCSGLFVQRARPELLVPPALAAASLLNGLFVFHADAMEVWRHSLMTVVGLAVAYVFGLLLILDNACIKRAGGNDH